MINSKLLNKLINWKVLTGIFIFIVILSELLGVVANLYNSRLIHLISIVYLLMAILITVKLPNLKNSKFQAFFSGFIMASIILGMTHIIEYIGTIVIETELFDMIMDLIVIGLTIIGMIIILISIMTLLNGLFTKHIKSLYFHILAVSALAIVLSSIFFFPMIIGSIENLAMWMVFIGMLIAGIVTIESFRMASKFPVFKDFLKNIDDGVMLLTFSIVFESLEVIKIPQLNVVRGIYLSHYLFFLAMSVILLGLMKIYNMSGVYEEGLPDSELVKLIK